MRALPFAAPTRDSAITATERYVYLLRGDTLTALDAATLREVARARLDAGAIRSGRGRVPSRLSPVPSVPPEAPSAFPDPPAPPETPFARPTPRAPQPPRPPRALAPPLGERLLDSAPYPGPPPGAPRAEGARAPYPGPPPGAPRLPGVNAPYSPGPPPVPDGFRNDGYGPPGNESRLEPTATITATERFVYVLRGETLYAFDARTLRQVARAELR